MRRISALIFLLVILTSGVVAQSCNDSTVLSSFRKGRNLVGLSDTISSSYKVLKSNPTLIRFDFGVNQYGGTDKYARGKYARGKYASRTEAKPSSVRPKAETK